MKCFLKWLLLSPLVLAGLYILILCFPQPLFPYKSSFENLSLYCDEPLSEKSVDVLKDIQRRLGTSVLYKDRHHENIFVCNQEWRHRLFFSAAFKSGGLAYCFAPWNAFLRKSDVDRNILFNKKGESSGPDRPFSYFAAHEVTHGLTVWAFGPWVLLRSPSWMTEGYADYVGKGGNFNFRKNLALFRKNDPSLDPKVTGLYLRYHLMVAQVLEKEHKSVRELFLEPEDGAEIQDELLAR
jgi:hypothetical protein